MPSWSEANGLVEAYYRYFAFQWVPVDIHYIRD